MIKTVIGDILDATEDIICHQVNCRGVMGAGVAKTLCTRWPIIKKTYIRYCRRFENQNELLGHVLSVEVEPNKTVLNIFGQLDYGRDKYRKYTDYVALTKAFDEIRSKYHNKSLAFPYGFGCGLAMVTGISLKICSTHTFGIWMLLFTGFRQRMVKYETILSQ